MSVVPHCRCMFVPLRPEYFASCLKIRFRTCVRTGYTTTSHSPDKNLQDEYCHQKQPSAPRNRTGRPTAETIRHSGNHSDVVIVALQHHRQHLHWSRCRSDGNQRTGDSDAADEPDGGIWFAGGSRCIVAHINPTRTGQQRPYILHPLQRRHAQRTYRSHVHNHRTVFFWTTYFDFSVPATRLFPMPTISCR